MPEQAHRGELGDELHGKALFLVPALGVGGDLGARELADALAQEAVVLGRARSPWSAWDHVTARGSRARRATGYSVDALEQPCWLSMQR